MIGIAIAIGIGIIPAGGYSPYQKILPRSVNSRTVGVPLAAVDGLDIDLTGKAVGSRAVGQPTIACSSEDISMNGKAIDSRAVGQPTIAAYGYQSISMNGKAVDGRAVSQVTLAENWTPAKLSPDGWYRSSLDIMLDDTTVNAWGDQSGNSYSVAMHTKASQPGYDTSGTWPWLTFSSASSQYLFRGAADTTSTSYTFWCVVRATDLAANHGIAINGVLGTNGYSWGHSSSGTRKTNHDGTAVDCGAMSGDPERWILSHAGSTTAPVLWVDGTPVACSSIAAATAPGAAFRIGVSRIAAASVYWTGNIAEIGIVGRVLTAVEKGCLSRWLLWAYPP